MVIGKLQQEPGGHASAPAGSAWAEVEAAQRQVQLPCLLVPQPAHAVLAGEVAAGLTCFGELPAEIKRAIQMHDTGLGRERCGSRFSGCAPGALTWPRQLPVSFIAVGPGEAEEAWTASINTVEGFSRVGAIIISRHFSLLAQNDLAHHQRFVQAEKSRQRKLEGAAKADDLDRWTAALGFCDLVSLFLLSAPGREAEFPLAHPSSPQAGTAPRVKMQMRSRKSPLYAGDSSPRYALSIQALRHPVPAQGPRAETLTWHVQ